MFRECAIVLALLVTFWCVWSRRHTWRYPWDRVVTVSVALQVLGLVLCAPIETRYLGRWLHDITNIWHLDDFFGHGCFIAATVCVIYAVARRVTPPEYLEAAMRPVEAPAIIAANIMLISLTLSHSQRVNYQDDFLDVPADGWLKLYWLTYSAIVLYLLAYLAFLLAVLRRDPRSKRTAEIYIAAIAFGVAALLIRTCATLFPALHVPGLFWWAGSIAVALAAFASGLSWRQRLRPFRDGYAPDDAPDGALDVSRFN